MARCVDAGSGKPRSTVPVPGKPNVGEKDGSVTSRADWHVHTHLSDGFAAPEEIVREAGALGLSQVAITDHDCVDAHRNHRLPALCAELHVDLVTGVELDCSLDDAGIEILGYGFNPDAPALIERLTAIQTQRRLRFEFYCAGLMQAGEPLDAQCSPAPLTQVPMKIHLYRALQAAGRVFTGGYAGFKAQLAQFGPAPEIARPTLQEAAALIRAAGGYTLLAHPLYYSQRPGLEKLVRAAAAAGCVGAERIYPYDFGESDFDERQIREGLAELERLARACFPPEVRFTRGSDVHDLREWEARLQVLTRWEQSYPAGAASF